MRCPHAHKEQKSLTCRIFWTQSHEVLSKVRQHCQYNHQWLSFPLIMLVWVHLSTAYNSHVLHYPPLVCLLLQCLSLLQLCLRQPLRDSLFLELVSISTFAPLYFSHSLLSPILTTLDLGWLLPRSQSHLLWSSRLNKSRFVSHAARTMKERMTHLAW